MPSTPAIQRVTTRWSSRLRGAPPALAVRWTQLSMAHAAPVVAAVVNLPVLTTVDSAARLLKQRAETP